MAQQTAYANNPAAAYAGQVVPQEGTVIWSKLASGNVPIGMLCSPGTQSLSAPGGVATGVATVSSTLPTDGNAGQIIAYPSGHTDDPVLDAFALGVPIRDSALMAGDQVSSLTDGTLTYAAYLDKQTVPVLRKGVLWVYSDAATTQFGTVYVYTTHETNSPLGLFSYGAGTGKSLFSRGRWLMTTAGAGLSLLEVW
jgi:hypothetical protein